jgi:hypothetical protein
MLATFVKWPIMKDTPPQKLPPHICLGIIGILLINLFQKQKIKHSVTSVKAKYISTNAGGTSLGMTSIFY